VAVTTLMVSGWLVFDRRRILRTHVKEPALERGEKAIRITLEVPAALFRDPALAATIRLDGEMPAELRTEVVADVERGLLEVPHVHVDLVREASA